MWNFFQNRRLTVTYEQVQHLLNKLEEDLTNNYSEQAQSDFLYHLSRRQFAFEYMIRHSNHSQNKQRLINAYYAFAQALSNGLADPAKIESITRQYYSSPDYMRVGGIRGEFSETAYDRYASYMIKLSLIILAVAMVVLYFNVPFGVVVLSLGILAMLPSIYYILKNAYPNDTVVRKEEDALFDTYNLLINEDNRDLSMVKT